MTDQKPVKLAQPNSFPSWSQATMDSYNRPLAHYDAAMRNWNEAIRELRTLRQQLQGATANEQSMVEQTAHNRDQLALVVKQKDDISVRCANLEKALKNARYGFMDIALLCADANRRSPQHSASATGGRLRKALQLAQSELNYQYQTLCSSVCPPCKQGECYDYSELRPPERAEIDRVEAALDAVDVALAETEDK